MTEYTLCEKPIIEALQSTGWKYVPGKELPRESYEEPLLVERLKDAIKRFLQAPGYDEIQDEDVERAILRLKTCGSGAQGIKETLGYLRSGRIPMDLGRRGLRYIPIIDHENPGNNEFIVSNQVEFRSAGWTIRADMVLFVNGIPLVIIECKDPSDEAVSWYDAYRDIKFYEKKVPELFRYVQIGVAADDIDEKEKGRGLKLFPIIPWKSEVKASVWRDEEGSAGIDGLKAMLEPSTFLDILRNFIFMTQQKGEDTKIIPRYMQYYAVKRIYSRVIDRITGKDDKSRGLIWHWQGSGKTYTMIFSAYKIYTDPRMEKPSIFFIVDRRELQDQMERVLGGMDLGGLSVEKIRSIEEFRKILRHDGGMGKRGLFILLIQKFRPEESDEEAMSEDDLREVQKEVETLPISERKNIVLFIDEGHRTQYGVLASEMRRIFRSAFMFAFTGTPVDKNSRNTYMEFSYPPEENYLHRYFIEESIRDGYTVPIAYRFIKEDMTFDSKVFESLTEDLFESDEEMGEVRKRFRTVNEMLTKPEMIEKKAERIIESFMKRENKVLKGMVVAANRKACVLYKDAIDRYMKEHYPDEWSEDFAEVVMTYNNKEKEEEIEEFRKTMEKRYGTQNYELINRKITENFKEKDRPKLLIVTDKLLTGFDAPVLQIMYLDKVMNGHTLLQAIARTNRPFEGKDYGLVMDYVGVYKRFEKTLKEYYVLEERAPKITVNMEELVEALKESIEEMESLLKGDFLPDRINRGDRQTIDRCISRIMEIGDEGSIEESFLELYRKINRIYDLLGPSEVKAERQIRDKVRAIRHIYAIYRKRFGKEVDPSKIEEDISELRKALYESIGVRDLEPKAGVVMDEEYLEKLRKNMDVDDSIILDMASVLSRYVLKLRDSPWADVVYGDIIESIENSVDRWRRREIDPEEAYRSFIQHMEEINEREGERRELNTDDLGFAMFMAMKRILSYESDEEYARIISELRKELKEQDLLFPKWYEKAEAKRVVAETIRKALLKFLVAEKKMPYQEAKESIEEIKDRFMKILERSGYEERV